MRQVHLTIDTEYPDRPSPDPLGTLDGMLEVLASRSVAATFFIVGSWARAHPDRVTAIRAAGHQIGNHSYSHCNLARLTPNGVIEDLRECHQALADLGIDARPWFRAPYGELTSDRAIAAAIQAAGYRHVPWSADSEDWRSQSPGEVAQRAVAAVERRWPRRAVLLMHSWPATSADALAMLIDELAQRGAGFAVLSRSRWGRG